MSGRQQTSSTSTDNTVRSPELVRQ